MQGLGVWQRTFHAALRPKCAVVFDCKHKLHMHVWHRVEGDSRSVGIIDGSGGKWWQMAAHRVVLPGCSCTLRCCCMRA
jgi:hypothetical protein